MLGGQVTENAFSAHLKGWAYGFGIDCADHRIIFE